MTRLGALEILGPLGAGGMGEVFRVRGRVVDRRVDVWALGVVVFEMLAGRRPFAGETIRGTIAAILKDDPGWTMLPAATPGALRRLLARMLEKDPRKRLRDVGDVRFRLDEVTASGASAGSGATALDGKWIFFRDAPGQILVVEVTRRPQLTLSAPRVIAGAEGLMRRPEGLISVVGFDISRDGTRLLMMRPAVVGERRPPAVVVVQGWHTR